MNNHSTTCIDVRRSLLIDPSHLPCEYHSHIAECVSCASFKDNIQQFNEDIKESLTIPVPNALSARILHNHHHGKRKQKIKQRIAGFSLAATLLLAVGMLTSLNHSQTSASLAELAINHVTDELDHLYIKNNVSMEKLNRVLAYKQLKVSQSLGKVNYAGKCFVANKSAIHIVLEGRTGPVTLLVIEGKKLAHKEFIKSKRFSGVIVPMAANNKNLAIIGEPDEPISELENQILPLLQSV